MCVCVCVCECVCVCVSFPTGKTEKLIVRILKKKMLKSQLEVGDRNRLALCMLGVLIGVLEFFNDQKDF